MHSRYYKREVNPVYNNVQRRFWKYSAKTKVVSKDPCAKIVDIFQEKIEQNFQALQQIHRSQSQKIFYL